MWAPKPFSAFGEATRALKAYILDEFAALANSLESQGRLRAYTPVLTGVGSNPAIGNGTIEGSFYELFNTVTFSAKITFGSTSTFGSGIWRISLPSRRAIRHQFASGVVWCNRSGNPQVVGTLCFLPSINDRAEMIVHGSNTPVDPAVPFTWANGHSLYVTGNYAQP